jgi:hypothetical protein
MSDDGVRRYPLDWPVGEPRTPYHRREVGRFEVEFGRARDELLRELRLLGARDVVISSNIPTRADGLPYANAPKRLDDPGVAVYWVTRRYDSNARKDVTAPFVMACDRYRTAVANIRAIGLSVEALRALERHGTKAIRDRAFSGFAALPAQAGASSWRTVLGLGDAQVSADDVERAYRRAAMTAHPDRGGTTEAMSEVTRARADALREVNRV